MVKTESNGKIKAHWGSFIKSIQNVGVGVWDTAKSWGNFTSVWKKKQDADKFVKLRFNKLAAKLVLCPADILTALSHCDSTEKATHLLPVLSDESKSKPLLLSQSEMFVWLGRRGFELQCSSFSQRSLFMTFRQLTNRANTKVINRLTKKTNSW